MPQWSNPSTLNQVKGRGEEYMTYGELWSTSKRQAFKIETGKRASHSKCKAPPRSSHEWKDDEMGK